VITKKAKGRKLEEISGPLRERESPFEGLADERRQTSLSRRGSGCKPSEDWEGEGGRERRGKSDAGWMEMVRKEEANPAKGGRIITRHRCAGFPSRT
jgi:hypothetical protein